MSILDSIKEAELKSESLKEQAKEEGKAFYENTLKEANNEASLIYQNGLTDIETLRQENKDSLDKLNKEMNEKTNIDCSSLNEVMIKNKDKAIDLIIRRFNS